MRASVRWAVLVVGLMLGACADDDASPDAGGSVNPSVPGAAFDSGTGLPAQPGVGDGGSTIPVVPVVPVIPGFPMPGTADAGSGSTGSSDGGTTGVPPATGAGAPVLPAVTGECPKFATGTASIGGLSGISLQVGAKKEGGGSLLFYWHGTGSSSGEVNLMVPAAVRNEILQNGGIIVSPQGSLRSGGDCSGTGTFSKDDFKVADLIAACAVRDHNIDPRRIYTSGCSAGGLQAGCMAALRASYIAAAVPNSGGIVFPQAIQQSSAKPAIMTMHGGPNDVVVVTFSETSKTLDNQFKTAGSYVVNCNHGGGHCGAPAPLYTAGWEFMKAHPYGVSPAPYGATLPSSFPDYCKVY